MEQPKFNLPDGIYVNPNERAELLNLAEEEQNNGALAFGVFGSRTINSKGNDIDVIIIKKGIQKAGLTKRQGIFHLNYFSPESLLDPLATFAKQAFSSAEFVFNNLSRPLTPNS